MRTLSGVSACWRIARKKPMTARPKLVMARIVLIHASVVRSSAMLVRKAASFVRRSARGTRGSDGGVSVMAARGVPSGGPTVQGNLRTAAVSGERDQRYKLLLVWRGGIYHADTRKSACIRAPVAQLRFKRRSPCPR